MAPSWKEVLGGTPKYDVESSYRGENELSVKSRMCLRIVVCNRTFSIYNFFSFAFVASEAVFTCAS